MTHVPSSQCLCAVSLQLFRGGSSAVFGAVGRAADMIVRSYIYIYIYIVACGRNSLSSLKSIVFGKGVKKPFTRYPLCSFHTFNVKVKESNGLRSDPPRRRMAGRRSTAWAERAVEPARLLECEELLDCPTIWQAYGLLYNSSIFVQRILSAQSVFSFTIRTGFCNKAISLSHVDSFMLNYTDNLELRIF